MDKIAEIVASVAILAALKPDIGVSNAQAALLEMVNEDPDLLNSIKEKARTPIGKQSLLTRLLRPPRISLQGEDMQKEKEYALALCYMPHTKESLVHNLIFKSIYKFFTGYAFSENSCWSKIGLSAGGDFNNDFIPSVGMMGALQILYIVEKYPEFCKHLQETITDKKIEFHLVRILAFLSRHVYDAFIVGDINRLVNHIPEKTVMQAMLKFYCAAAFKFNKLWAAKKYTFATIMDCIEKAVGSCSKDAVAKTSKYLILMRSYTKAS
jgi:hypothetical protein